MVEWILGRRMGANLSYEGFLLLQRWKLGVFEEILQLQSSKKPSNDMFALILSPKNRSST